MAIWKEPTTAPKDAKPTTKDAAATPNEATPAAAAADLGVRKEPEHKTEHVASILPTAEPRTATPRDFKESVIAHDITITGKIDGAGHVRIAGRFEGDVNIQGDLTIDSGAKLTGNVHANSVRIAGEVEGNIDSAASVEMLSTGVLNGDLNADTLTVASGSRMRGRVQFGWTEEQKAKGAGTREARRTA